MAKGKDSKKATKKKPEKTMKEKRNAKKMVKKLKKSGFNAFIVGKRKGLWTVSYNSFVTKKEAVNALGFAQNHNEKAWILNQ